MKIVYKFAALVSNSYENVLSGELDPVFLFG
jgi:hypothetical protein